MSTQPRKTLTNERRGDIAFRVVVFVSYLLTLASEPDAFLLPGGAILIAAGVVYWLVGAFSYPKLLKRISDLPATLVYLAFEIPLGR